MSACEGKRGISASTVSDHHRPPEIQGVAQHRKLVGVELVAMNACGGRGLAMSWKVDRDRPMGSAEMIELRLHEPVVAGSAVDEQHGRVAATSFDHEHLRPGRGHHLESADYAGTRARRQ
jgi:hypothetical protein